MTRRPHVLVVVENVPIADDTRARKQIESLSAHGYDVSVISPRDPSNDRFRGRRGIRVYDYPPAPSAPSAAAYVIEYGYSLAVATILSIVAHGRRRVDVVQLCAPPDVYVVLGWLFRLLGARVVVDQRDLLTALYAQRYGASTGPIPRILGWLEGISQRSADRVLVVNETLRRRALEASGVRPERVSIVRNGPRLSGVERATADPALRDGRRYLACWTGLMGRQDRLDLLVESIAHLVHGLGRTDCAIAIVGDGEVLDEMKALAERLDVTPWVSFPGWLTEEGLFAYLATADLGLDASLQAEVSPVKAVEYMAFGLPFVAFDLPETRRTGRDAAAYAEPGDVRALAGAIDALLDDRDARRSMGARARDLVERELAWDRQEPEYLGAIERVRLASRADPNSPVRAPG